MVLQLDIETDLWLFIFLFTVTVHRRLQSVFLYCNLLLLLLYCTPLTWKIAISIPLSVSVYGDIGSYCSFSLLHLTHYYLLFISLASTVSLLLCFPLRLLYRSYSICSLYVYCIIALTIFSSLNICKTENRCYLVSHYFLPNLVN